MAVSDLVNLSGLMDDAKCFAFVRQRRWPEGIRCPACDNDAVIRDGHDDTQPCRQRYRCKACTGRFDDLTGTVLAGHHQPLRVWVLCLYFMGLNLSNRQIALELGLDASGTQAMTEQLRHGLVAKTPAVELTGEVEVDEVYVVAGHKRRRGSESGLFGLHKASGNCRLLRVGFRWEAYPVREAASLPGSSSLGLKRSQAKQGKPVRMALAGHQLPRALALALGASAAHEAAMVQEEAQQIEIRVTQVPAQGEVGAQPRVEVLDERAAARRIGHGPAHGVE